MPDQIGNANTPINLQLSNGTEIQQKQEIQDSPAFKTPDSRINNRKLRSSTLSSGSKSPLRRHRRNLSGNSASSVSTTATNSARKGINLGISVINSGGKGKAVQSQPSVTNNIAENSTNTTAPKNNGAMTPSRQLVFPSSPKSGIDSKNNTDDKISENFKLLASKELEILEIKNRLKELMNVKREKELELQYLKRTIERQLLSKNQSYTNNNMGNSNGMPKSPTSAQKHRIKSYNSNIDPLLDDSFMPIQAHSDDNKRNSWFAKPLNFIQNFDNLIYKEFEKLQITDLEERRIGPRSGDILDENDEADDDVDDVDDDDDDDDDDYFIDMNYNHKQHGNAETSLSTDVLQSVSQHLWSFVNDVKSNLLTEEEQKPEEVPVLASSSPVKPRLRTASISKRKTYSQHAKHGSITNHVHKKRPSMNISEGKNNDTNNVNKNTNTNNLEITNDQKSSIVKDLSRNSIQVTDSKPATELKSGDNVVLNDSDLWSDDEVVLDI